jgi:hypothetical protein
MYSSIRVGRVLRETQAETKEGLLGRRERSLPNPFFISERLRPSSYPRPRLHLVAP